MVSAKLDSISVAQRTGSISENVNYAIKAVLVQQLLQTLVEVRGSLVPERVAQFRSTEDLIAAVDSATFLVVAIRNSAQATTASTLVTEKYADISEKNAARLGFIGRDVSDGVLVVRPLRPNIRVQEGDIILCHVKDRPVADDRCRQTLTYVALMSEIPIYAEAHRGSAPPSAVFWVRRDGVDVLRSITLRD